MSPRSRLLFILAAALAAPAPWAQTHGTADLPSALAEPKAPVRWVQPVAAFCEGPAWDGENLYFTEHHGKDTLDWPIWRHRPEAGDPAGAVFLAASEQANGLALDRQGRLAAAQRRKVSRFDAAGKAVVLAESTAAVPFGNANDLAFGADGTLWFTALDGRVFRAAAGGAAKVAATGLKAANGILPVDEAGHLYVADAADSLVLRYPIKADGTLGPAMPFAALNRPDGMALDEIGNLYVASNVDGQVHVFDPSGARLGSIPVIPAATHNVRKGPGGNTSNCEFGGADLRTLYITGDGGLYAVRLKVAGRRPAEPNPILRPRRTHGPGDPALVGLRGGPFDALGRPRFYISWP